MQTEQILPGFKEAILTQNINSIGGGGNHKNGDVVRYMKDGDFYHYLNQQNTGLVKSKGNYIMTLLIILLSISGFAQNHGKMFTIESGSDTIYSKMESVSFNDKNCQINVRLGYKKIVESNNNELIVRDSLKAIKVLINSSVRFFDQVKELANENQLMKDIVSFVRVNGTITDKKKFNKAVKAFQKIHK